jgi:hypothetical protein
MSAIDLGSPGKDDIYGYGLVNGAAAALPSEMRLTATRTLGPPKLDAESIWVAGAPYEITITNSGLNRVLVEVFEGEVLRKDLSVSYHFGSPKPQEVVFGLDATEIGYSVLFTPYGRRDTFAEIVFRMDPQPGER